MVVKEFKCEFFRKRLHSIFIRIYFTRISSEAEIFKNKLGTGNVNKIIQSLCAENL